MIKLFMSLTNNNKHDIVIREKILIKKKSTNVLTLSYLITI